MGADSNKTFFKKAEQEKLKAKDIFRDVFRRHTKEETSRIFLAGTPFTTPDESAMLANWIRPYLFARILLAGLVLVAAGICMGNELMLPFIFLTGSFLVPVVVMIFFWEMNIPRNISFATVLVIFFAGGMLSLVFTTILYHINLFEGSALYLLTVGIVEESAKVLASMVWLRDKNKKYILTGMLAGAAVGAGFAAVESAGYAIVRYGWSFDTMMLRAVFAPGGHVAWAAVTGGALVWAKGEEKLCIRHLLHPVFLGAFIFCVVTHAFWDCGYLFVMLPIWALIVYALYVVLKKGLNQITEAALRCNQGRLTAALEQEEFFGDMGHIDMPVQMRLSGVSGVFAGRRFALTGCIRIGRDPQKNNLVFPADTAGISGVHCEILVRGSSVCIRDRGSRYGTYVGGARLAQGQVRQLNSGDIVCLGGERQKFQVTYKGGKV